MEYLPIQFEINKTLVEELQNIALEKPKKKTYLPNEEVVERLFTKQQKKDFLFSFLLVILLIFVFMLATGIGAVEISATQIFSILLKQIGIPPLTAFSEQQEAVFLAIRLPRVVLGILVGGVLGITGASMQGLFRNPLVEPSLVGVSAGSAFMAVLVIVFGKILLQNYYEVLSIYLLPFASFIGGLAATFLAYHLATHSGKTGIATLILAGVAINALAGAGIGMVLYFADDAAIRNFTFWSLGNLGSGSWERLLVAAPLMLLPAILLFNFYKALNAIAMGESEAYYLGVPVQKIKLQVILLSALAVGTSVALAGIIGFIGLVVPHLARLLLGSNNRMVLKASMLLGAIMLTFADLLARMLIAPSELPIGIVTALIGAPFFIVLLMKMKRQMN